MPPHIPPLLSLYLPLPSASLTLITAVLDAPPNWLTLRYIYAALNGSRGGATGPSNYGAEEGRGVQQHGEEMRSVVLVSFLRDLSFWRGEGRRLVSFLFRLASFYMAVVADAC